MANLLDYINSLDSDGRVQFSRRCGTTVGYLRKAVSVGQRLKAELCINIERESGGAVTCELLRPDVDWKVLRKPVPKHPAALTRQAQGATETVAEVA